MMDIYIDSTVIDSTIAIFIFSILFSHLVDKHNLFELLSCKQNMTNVYNFLLFKTNFKNSSCFFNFQ